MELKQGKPRSFNSEDLSKEIMSIVNELPVWSEQAPIFTFLKIKDISSFRVKLLRHVNKFNSISGESRKFKVERSETDGEYNIWRIS